MDREGKAFCMGMAVEWVGELRAAPTVREGGRDAPWSMQGLKPVCLGKDPLPALPRAFTRSRSGSRMVPAPSRHPER